MSIFQIGNDAFSGGIDIKSCFTPQTVHEEEKQEEEEEIQREKSLHKLLLALIFY